MFEVGQAVQILDHAEPSCNGQYGTVQKIEIAYDGYTHYYTVELDDSQTICLCIDDEIMEG